MFIWAIILFLFLVLSSPSFAAYNIYLRNGSVITGVSSYEKADGEVNIIFKGGSLGIPSGDILKIEETGTAEKDFRLQEVPGKQEDIPPAASSVPSETAEKSSRLNELNTEIEKVNSEIRGSEAEEARLVAEINQKRGKKTYNYFQLRKLEQETEPLQQDLFAIQQKKKDLLQRKASLENETKALQ